MNKLSGMLVWPNARILIVTNKYSKAVLLARQLDLTRPSFTKTYFNGARIRVVAAPKQDMHILAGLEATHIYYDSGAGYDEPALTWLKSRLRSVKYDGPFVLESFVMEDFDV